MNLVQNIGSRRFLVAALVALIAATIFKLSYFQENPEAYLFPSIVGGAMLLMALISLFREAFDVCVDDFQGFPFRRQLPAIVLMTAGVLALEELGMYSTCFLVLLLVSAWYSPQQNLPKRLLNSFLFSAGFIGFMYLLFSLLLKVQVPRGWLI